MCNNYYETYLASLSLPKRYYFHDHLFFCEFLSLFVCLLAVLLVGSSRKNQKIGVGPSEIRLHGGLDHPLEKKIPKLLIICLGGGMRCLSALVLFAVIILTLFQIIKLISSSLYA